MKIEFKQGWYKVRGICGFKFEVTYFDGRRRYCDDRKFSGGYPEASSYCKAAIIAA